VDLLEGGYPPRSDGLTWTCAGDLDGDGINDGDMFNNPHPEPNGAQKNADQIYAFFKTDPTATPWYLEPATHPPDVTITADTLSGPAPLTVHFSAAASATAPGDTIVASVMVPEATIVEYVWSFGDGTFSYNPEGRANPENDPAVPSFYNNAHPTKIFYVPGVYTAYLTVTDSLGNATTATISINVE
jgi:PKD repeat protein